MTKKSYLLRGIPLDLWRAVKVQAAHRGETVRAAMLRLLAAYAGGARER